MPEMTDHTPGPVVLATQHQIFEIALDLHRASRALYLISNKYRLPSQLSEDFDELPFGPLHLPYKVFEGANAAADEVREWAEKLIKISMVTEMDLFAVWDRQQDNEPTN